MLLRRHKNGAVGYVTRVEPGSGVIEGLSPNRSEAAELSEDLIQKVQQRLRKSGQPENVGTFTVVNETGVPMPRPARD